MHELELQEHANEAPAAAVLPQCGGQGCTCHQGAPGGCSCGGNGLAPPQYVYAIGRIEPRFPRISVERELGQAIGREETAGLTDRQALHAALAQPANRYLVRHLCWVLTIEGLETYLLQPRDPRDLGLLVEALRPAPRPADVDVVIGTRGPLAPATLCNGLIVPVVTFDQIYSFDADQLRDSVPRPEGAGESYGAAVEEVFRRVLQLADNAGASDEHRALNYLSVRYPGIYTTAVDAFQRNFSLAAVEVRPSHLSGLRNVVDAIFTYTNRQTDVSEKHFVRVDVTDLFPFLVTKVTPYYDR